MKASILSALYEADGYVSGQQLCDKLAVSRTAVWKVVNQLKEEGYVIESVPRKGYRILERPDCITAEEVQSRLQGRHAEWNIVYYDRIDSSNNEAKRMAEAGEQRTTLVLAGEQTGGKGRRGRVWVTPKDTGDCDESVAASVHPAGACVLSDTGDGTCHRECVPGILQC